VEDDLVLLEKKMNELAKKNSAYLRKEMPKAEAIEYLQGKGMSINWIYYKT